MSESSKPRMMDRLFPRSVLWGIATTLICLAVAFAVDRSPDAVLIAALGALALPAFKTLMVPDMRPYRPVIVAAAGNAVGALVISVPLLAGTAAIVGYDLNCVAAARVFAAQDFARYEDPHAVGRDGLVSETNLYLSEMHQAQLDDVRQSLRETTHKLMTSLLPLPSIYGTGNELDKARMMLDRLQVPAGPRSRAYKTYQVICWANHLIFHTCVATRKELSQLEPQLRASHPLWVAVFNTVAPQLLADSGNTTR